MIEQEVERVQRWHCEGESEGKRGVAFGGRCRCWRRGSAVGGVADAVRFF